jgi:predicted transcriptional regulator
MPDEVARPSIREAVAEQLGNLSDRTRAAVVEHFAAEQATKQANAIVAGLSKLAELEKERVRIKPTAAGFNAGGEQIGEAMFSKEQIDQMKKLDEQLEKWSKAINKADDKGDFGDLYNLTK